MDLLIFTLIATVVLISIVTYLEGKEALIFGGLVGVGATVALYYLLGWFLFHSDSLQDVFVSLLIFFNFAFMYVVFVCM